MSTPAPVTTLTKEQLDRVLPTRFRNSVSPEFVDKVNSVLTDPLMADTLRENILGFTSVLKDGRFKMTDYLNAVRYTSYKAMGASNIVSYTRVFPDKYQLLLDRGASDKDISSYVANYNKNKLVILCYEQLAMPTHIVNADIFQKAINVQAELMITAKSELVRTQAANSLMTQLKPPEASKVEIDVKVSESSELQELRNATMDLVTRQRQVINAGAASAQEIAHSTVIKGECEVVADV